MTTETPNYRPEAYHLALIDNLDERAKEIQIALEKAFIVGGDAILGASVLGTRREKKEVLCTTAQQKK